jgi:hypothetical protein
MKRKKEMLMLALVFAACGASLVTAEKVKESAVQLVVDLTDGSRLIGETTLASLPLRSEILGNVKVPLQRIRLIQFSKDHESVTVSLENGDTLKGAVSTASLALQMLVGKFTVPMNQVSQIKVRTGPPLSPEGLVLYYPLDTNEIERIRDQSGNGDDGLVHGAEFRSSGEFGGSYCFNGQGDYIAVPFHPSYGFRATGEFTLAAWVKPVLRHGLAQGIIVKAPPGWAFEWGLYVDQQSHFMSGWERNHVVQSKAPAESDKWSHVAATYNDGNWVLYVNGTEEARATDQRITPTEGGLAIGRKGECTTFTDFFQGQIYDVRIYNRALAAEEISGLADAHRPDR